MQGTGQTSGAGFSVRIAGAAGRSAAAIALISSHPAWAGDHARRRAGFASQLELKAPWTVSTQLVGGAQIERHVAQLLPRPDLVDAGQGC
jgi:hypothetical protein